MIDSDRLRALSLRVADFLLERDMENEDWEKGTAVNGLLTLNEDKYVEEARRIVDRTVATQSDEGKFNYDDPKPWLLGEDPHRAQCEPATMGHGVLEFYDRTGEDRYLDAARRQFTYLVDEAKRSQDGGISYTTGPVALWVDSIYMVCPFFSKYARITGDERGFEEAVNHIETHAKHLQDPHTGLFRHEWRESPNTYPESSLWARGNGWATAGMIDTLSCLPEDHPSRSTVEDILQDQAEALLERQGGSGLWYHILDYPDSPLETSASLQYTYCFLRGHEMGLLGETFRDAAYRALEVCLGTVNEKGAVRRVAVPPGGPDAPLGVTSYGQGWFLMAADQYLSP